MNTEANEQAPFYHAGSSMLVFASDRQPGMGGYDLFMSKGSDMEWQQPENMGYPVNSARDDMYFFSAGQASLFDQAYFSSDRGSECCLATYTVTKMPKKKVLAGRIMDCATGDALADADVLVNDASGSPAKLRTDASGNYSLSIASEGQRQLEISKSEYLNKSIASVITDRNEASWHTDTLLNEAVCLDKEEKKLVIKVENVVTVYFDFDRSQLKERATAQMDSIYNILMENETTTIQISGYTDGLGSAAYNARLSDRRARSCADYLIKKGIDPARISFESFGACCPVEMELINGRDNPDGRSMNRRALINIDKKE